MQHLHAITVKYLPATNTRGSGVKLTSHRLNETKTIPIDYALNSIYAMAEQYLNSIGQTVQSFGDTKDGYILMVEPVNHSFLSIK